MKRTEWYVNPWISVLRYLDRPHPCPLVDEGPNLVGRCVLCLPFPSLSLLTRPGWSPEPQLWLLCVAWGIGAPPLFLFERHEIIEGV